MSRIDEIRTRVEAGVLDVETLMEVNRDMSDLLKFVDLMVESADLSLGLSTMTAVAGIVPGKGQEGLQALSTLYSAVHEQIHLNLKEANLE